jgi:meso-butanediol dehydrogenase/(S,S)-butanediol dehydrogenase/diacetyl reductase
MHLIDVTEENWHAIMDVNALGCLIGIQEGAKRMIPAEPARSSTLRPSPAAGLSQFRPVLREQVRGQRADPGRGAGLAPHNITCNAFAPGVVDTPLWSQLDADLVDLGDAERPGQAMADFAAGILRGRPATPDDLVGTALFLASRRFRLHHRSGAHGRRGNVLV